MEGEYCKLKYVVNKIESDESVSSVIFPWDTILRQHKPPLIEENQTGRSIEQLDFWLCLNSSSGICLFGTAMWIIIHHLIYCHYLINASFYLGAYGFSLCGGATSIPCSWICWATHNDRKKYYIFLPLLFLLLCFSLALLTTGIIFGVKNRLAMAFDYKAHPPQLEGHYREQLKESMISIINTYKTSYKNRTYWNRLQKHYHCCGIDGTKYRSGIIQEISSSCYPNLAKNATGCLDIIGLHIAQETCLLTGFTFIVCVIQVCMLALTGGIYLWEHRQIHFYMQRQ